MHHLLEDVARGLPSPPSAALDLADELHAATLATSFSETPESRAAQAAKDLSKAFTKFGILYHSGGSYFLEGEKWEHSLRGECLSTEDIGHPVTVTGIWAWHIHPSEREEVKPGGWIGRYIRVLSYKRTETVG